MQQVEERNFSRPRSFAFACFPQSQKKRTRSNPHTKWTIPFNLPYNQKTVNCYIEIFHPLFDLADGKIYLVLIKSSKPRPLELSSNLFSGVATESRPKSLCLWSVNDQQLKMKKNSICIFLIKIFKYLMSLTLPLYVWERGRRHEKATHITND